MSAARRLVVAVGGAAALACIPGPADAPRPAGAGAAPPAVAEATWDIKELELPTPRSGPSIVAIGPDQSVWAALARAGKLAQVAPDGSIREYPLAPGAFPVGLLVEPGGAVWVTDIKHNAIVRLEPGSGATRSFTVPTPGAWPFQLVRRADGVLFFTERVGNKIGRLDPRTGTFREFPVPTAGAQPAGLAMTPDGQLFFTENSANQIGRLDPETGVVTELKIPSPASPGPYYGPAGIASDAQGNVWFAELDGRLGLIRRGARDRIEEIALPDPRVRPGGIAVDPWGWVWFTGLDGNMIGSFHPVHGVHRSYPIPSGQPDPQPMSPPEVSARGEQPMAGLKAQSTRPFGIAVDLSGRVWFSEQYGHRLGFVRSAPVDLVAPAGVVRDATAALVVARRGLEHSTALTHLLDGQPAAAGEVRLASLSPGEHRWTVIAARAGAPVFQKSATFVVEPSLELIADALDGGPDAAVPPALRALLDRSLVTARRHLAEAKGDMARGALREMVRVLDDGGAADTVLAQHLRHLGQFGRLDVEVSGCPAEIVVQPGDQVRWTATTRERAGGGAGVRIAAKDGTFASGPLRAGDTFTHAFHREGTHEYSCDAAGSASASARRSVVRVVPRIADARLHPMRGPGRVPTVLALDGKGGVWFTAGGGGYAQLAEVPLNNKIGYLAPDGQIAEYETPTAESAPTSLKIGPDGRVWFTERAGNRIGVLDPRAGRIREIAIPTPDSQPTGLAVGPDGTVWFTEKRASKIGRLDPSTLQITELATPTPEAEPSTVVVDGQGHVWFDERAADNLVRLDPATGQMRQYRVPTRGSRVVGLVPDPRGFLWFLELAGQKVGRLEVETGQVVEYAIPTRLASPFKAALDGRGRLWFTQASGNRVGVLDQGRFFELALPVADSMPGGIEIEPDGDVWVALQARDALARLPRAAAVAAAR